MPRHATCLGQPGRKGRPTTGAGHVRSDPVPAHSTSRVPAPRSAGCPLTRRPPPGSRAVVRLPVAIGARPTPLPAAATRTQVVGAKLQVTVADLASPAKLPYPHECGCDLLPEQQSPPLPVVDLRSPATGRSPDWPAIDLGPTGTLEGSDEPPRGTVAQLLPGLVQRPVRRAASPVSRTSSACAGHRAIRSAVLSRPATRHFSASSNRFCAASMRAHSKGISTESDSVASSCVSRRSTDRQFRRSGAKRRFCWINTRTKASTVPKFGPLISLPLPTVPIPSKLSTCTARRFFVPPRALESIRSLTEGRQIDRIERDGALSTRGSRAQHCPAVRSTGPASTRSSRSALSILPPPLRELFQTTARPRATDHRRIPLAPARMPTRSVIGPAQSATQSCGGLPLAGRPVAAIPQASATKASGKQLLECPSAAIPSPRFDRRSNVQRPPTWRTPAHPAA